MKSSTQPANDTRDRADYTDRRDYTADAAEAAAMGADTARCVVWADGLIERGVIGEEQRRDAERALVAMLTAGTSAGPCDDRARDLVRRMLIQSKKSTPVELGRDQRRGALVRVLPEVRRALNERGDLHWRETLRSLCKIDPEFRTVTREICDRALAPSDHRFAARLAVAVGAFGDRDEATAFKRFQSAAREQSRKPGKR